MFIRSTGEPVLAQVVGHSEHGDAYRCIIYDCDGKTVLHDRASVRRLSLPRVSSLPRPAQSEASSSTRAEQERYFTRDIPEEKWVPKNLLAPANPPTKKAKPPPKSAAQSIPVESGERVQEFKVKWSRTKKFYTEPVKDSRRTPAEHAREGGVERWCQ